MYNDLYPYYDFEAPSPTADAPDSSDEIDNTYDSSSSDGSVTIRKNGKYIHCLTIIGQIEGHYSSPSSTKSTKYEHIIPRLVAVEEDDNISGLLIILNTVGGDIEAGLAIAELISGMRKPTASLVLGGSHSIGVPLAVSTDKSFIVPTASMTIHPVRMSGVILGVPQTLLYLKRMEERVVSFVTRNCRVTPQRFRQLMLNNQELVSDFGTILDGDGAVKEGLIDCIGSLGDALDFLDSMEV